MLGMCLMYVNMRWVVYGDIWCGELVAVAPVVRCAVGFPSQWRHQRSSLGVQGFQVCCAEAIYYLRISGYIVCLGM